MSNLTLYRRGANALSEMNWLFDGMFGNTMSHAGSRPAVDVRENDDQYELIAELPGMDQKDVNVNINDGLLSIEARREVKEKEEDKYLLQERRSEYLNRSFRLPKNIEQGKIKADFANGLLTLKLPKVAEAKPQSIKIN